IEFANGSVSSEWGRIRAAMGHPKPFNMKMIGIGNEQWGSQYIERYKRFAAAIKEKYPEMQLIAATGSDATIFPNGQAEIDFLWDQWRKLEPEIVDEHFYRTPEWFIENVNYYDQYDRNGPKLFVGEYAAQSVGVGSPDNRNTWKCALFEAAFMTGLERNADLVTMSCYAPLFAHKDAWQWRPDLIWFDNLTAFGSANYQVQKLFSLYKGTRQLTATTANIPQLNQKAGTLFASATLDENEGTVLIKVVNVSDKNLSVGLDLKGVTKITGDARIVQLISDSLEAENTFEEPDKIVPIERTQSIAAPEFNLEFPHYSLTVIQIPVK
ncbi:alpha-L-arabinofuranosidase, partial [candidate division KSB1 bacterium]|nr:alpha-L-arabinofuranosidase [candidate division KSB1 bacterium]